MQIEEHHSAASTQYELAAKFYKSAHEYHLIGENEKSAFEIQKAQSHHKKADFHMNEIFKLNNVLNSTYSETFQNAKV